MQYSTILGIESSCDDTAASVLINGKIRSNVSASQAVHERYGGVVPELASRAHQENILPVVLEALEKAGVSMQEIDAIAYTKGPGLMGSLLVGINFAKGLGMALDKPLIGVDHLQAHVAALYIEHSPEFPFLCLLVSGGHTMLLLVKEGMDMDIVGSTLDDAAGEAFDKGAKMLGLRYPGGPLIDAFAQKGNAVAFSFPVSRMPALDFSFSGIKTSLLYFLRDHEKRQPGFAHARIADICASYQKAIVDMLLIQFEAGINSLKPRAIALCGGVSMNSELRTRVQKLGADRELPVYIPSFEYCTDNAAMIAVAGQMMLEK